VGTQTATLVFDRAVEIDDWATEVLRIVDGVAEMEYRSSGDATQPTPNVIEAFMSDVGEIVRWHHERWDGGGYPDGLSGEGIPLEARIITCCDSYNAMTTTRSYRAALTPDVAAQELRDCAGSQFDATVVQAVLDAVADSDAGAQPR